MKAKKQKIIKILFFGTLIFGMGGFLLSSKPILAATGINKQINFQGKVVNTDGTNVSNGSYNFLFCIYTTASPTTPCTSGADNDAVWRESKSLTVTDGIFQSNLGDTTALPGSVDFNTDNIYLGVNFNSNGQMTPLVRFTAAPYAMNADKVHGLNVTDTTGTLTITSGKTFTASNTLTLQGTDGSTLNVGTGGTLGTAAYTASTAYLVSGDSTQNGYFGNIYLDDTDASHHLILDAGSDLTADRILSIVTGDAARTLTFSGNLNVSADATISNTNTGDQSIFQTFAVSGQSNVVADSTTDTVTLIAGTNITITTNATNDEITINSTGGGSQTPWTSDINAAGYDLGSLSNLGFQETTGAPTGTDVGFYRDNTGDLTGNVLTGKTFNLAVNGTDEYNFSSTGLAMNSNDITGVGNITPSTDDNYDLGDNTHRFKDLYLGGDTLHIGTSTTDEGTLSYNTTSNILNFSTDSTSNADIAFFTDDLYLDKSTSYVGIGYTSPGARLDVTGDVTTASLGSEMITSSTDRDFTGSIGNWTAGSNWAYGTNNASHTAGTTGTLSLDNAYVDPDPVSGNLYQITFTVNTTTAGTLTVSFGSANGIMVGQTTGTNTQTQVITTTGTGPLTFAPDSAWAGTIDNVSVKLITPSNATQIVRNSDNTIGLEIRSGITPNNRGTFIGVGAGKSNISSGASNSFIGYSVGYSNIDGYYNSALGTYALYSNTTGNYNSALGTYALYSNTTGSNNSAMGASALYDNTIGTNNSAMGYQALQFNITGFNNSAMGYQALRDNTTGSNNTVMGSDVLLHNRTGSNNTAVGYQAAGYSVFDNSLSNNSLFGYKAGYALITGGDNNVLIGYQAGDAISSGANNILIGYDIDAQSPTGSNQLSIGNLIFATGGFGTGTTVGTGNVGIGDATPASLFTVGSGDLFQVNSSGAIAAATGLTTTGNITVSGAQILGGSPMIFEGTTDDNLTTTFAFTDPTTSNKTITFPNETGTVCTTGSVCSGYQASGSYANTALSNLASVAINTDLIGAVAGGMGIRGGSAANDDLILEGTTNATRTTSYVILQPNGGNVGIGTAAPASMLDIFGTANMLRLSYDATNYATLASDSTGNLVVNNSSAAQNIVLIGDGTATDSSVQFDGNVNDYYVGQDDTDDFLHIGTGSVVGTNAYITLDSTGKVGIGDVTPSFALDINGDAQIQGGELYITGVTSSASTTEGTVYYDNDDDNLYVYANGGWVDLTVQGGGSQTPWTSDINAAGYDLGSLSNIGFQETTGAPTGTDVGFYRDNTGDLTGNVLTGKTFNLAVNGTDEYNFSSTGLAMNSNILQDIGNTGTDFIASTGALTLAGVLTANGGISIGAQALTGTTGDINYTNFDVTGSNGNVDIGGTITAGSGNEVLTLSTGKIDADAISLITTGTDGLGTTSSATGLATYTDRLSLLQGCSDGQVLKWVESTDTWDCADDSAAAGASDTATFTDVNPAAWNGDNDTVELFNDATKPNIVTDSTSSTILVSLHIEGSTSNTSSDTFLGARLVYTTDGNDPSCSGSSQVGEDMVSSYAITTSYNFSDINGTYIHTPGVAGTIKYTVCSSSMGGPTQSDTAPSITVSLIELGADLAENYYTNDDSIEPGDVVVIEGFLPAGIKKSERAYDPKTIGVVSTVPGITLDDAIGLGQGRAVPVALAGRIPVKVSTENGRVKAGDYLTSSSVPGVAMKATKAGIVIGQALQNFNYPDSETGLVITFVKNAYFDGERTIDASGVSLTGAALLQKMLADKTQLAVSMDVSEITTDRVSAGLEIITPKLTTQELAADIITPSLTNTLAIQLASDGSVTFGEAGKEPTSKIDAAGNATFAGTLTAKSIKADSIEGLEIFTNKLSRLDTAYQNLSQTIVEQEESTSSELTAENGALNVENASVALDINADGKLEVEGLVVEDTARFKGETFFEKLATFVGKTIFKDLVEFEKAPVFDKNTAGYAVVKEGSDRVEITFDREYPVPPVVNASLLLKREDNDELEDAAAEFLLLSDIKFIVSKVTSKGFEIRINDKAALDTRFSWMAIAVNDPETFESKSQVKNEEELEKAEIVETGESTPVQTDNTLSQIDNIPQTKDVTQTENVTSTDVQTLETPATENPDASYESEEIMTSSPETITAVPTTSEVQ